MATREVVFSHVYFHITAESQGIFNTKVVSFMHENAIILGEIYIQEEFTLVLH